MRITILAALLLLATTPAMAENTSGTALEQLADDTCAAAGHGEAAYMTQRGEDVFSVVCQDETTLPVDAAKVLEALEQDIK